MVIRVKRQQETFFVDCDSKDSISKVKSIVSKMAKEASFPFPDSSDVRLLSGAMKPGTTGSDPNAKYTILEDSITLSDAKITDDQVVWMTFRTEQGLLGEWLKLTLRLGSWEDVNVPKFSDLDEEM